MTRTCILLATLAVMIMIRGEECHGMHNCSGSAAYHTSAAALNASLDVTHQPLVDAWFGSWASFEVSAPLVSCDVVLHA